MSDIDWALREIESGASDRGNDEKRVSHPKTLLKLKDTLLLNRSKNMSNNIVTTSETNIPGVELIYLPEIDAAGIHYRGLARLLGCDAMTVQRAAEVVTLEYMLEAQIQTEQGLRTVTFILEEGVIEVLEKIQDSTRIKKETRDIARQLYRQFGELPDADLRYSTGFPIQRQPPLGLRSSIGLTLPPRAGVLVPKTHTFSCNTPRLAWFSHRR
ncbi:MAG: hypothetical protein ACRC4X_05400 [Cetobacterium sp.]